MTNLRIGWLEICTILMKIDLYSMWNHHFDRYINEMLSKLRSISPMFRNCYILHKHDKLFSESVCQ